MSIGKTTQREQCSGIMCNNCVGRIQFFFKNNTNELVWVNWLGYLEEDGESKSYFVTPSDHLPNPIIYIIPEDQELKPLLDNEQDLLEDDPAEQEPVSITGIGKILKYKMCDDNIQIRADGQELQQFHHLVIRPVTPIFNPLGQYCQVRRCCSLSKYSTLRELHTHWQYLHQPNRQIYKCGKCRKMFGIKSRCFRHISFKHYVREDNIHKFLNTIVTPNVDYIETRGAMLPRLGTAEENSEFINRGKSEASRKREEEARASLVHRLTERLEAAEIMERDFS
ncbi:unnamed protein product [Mytilus edulis]|uniref:C2H2-type domain-containing protein n=1 Tax=Mytilus edulis TaxID=6550 RepID=A0A8S3TXD9_MYTED|nr:unnamed protein product [Mytilus edulis]